MTVLNNRMDVARDGELSRFAKERYSTIVISLAQESANTTGVMNEDTASLFSRAMQVLEYGGLLFVYGRPRGLAVCGDYLSAYSDDAQQLIFKYWLALDIDDAPADDCLKPTHMGLLMYVKTRSDRKSPTLYRLNTDTVRLPHAMCQACGRTLKDWGGKKHLMNPRGAALSDVWRDLPRRTLNDSIIPDDVLVRVQALTEKEEGRLLHIIPSAEGADPGAAVARADFPTLESIDFTGKDQRISLEADQILETDCVSFLDSVAASQPKGVFDLAFADPPYNLQKLYGHYEDALSEQRYIRWCNEWLEGMARTLKPGGSLFVLNLPKWAVHHAAFLNGHLEFRHWIVWDALSDPRGKLMPAHYALLWYTKPGSKPTVNYAALGSSIREGVVCPPDSPRYCLRAGCVKERKRNGDDEKVELSDVWFDIHRIKHKRDRDSHPCQLPEKLLERIILLTTNPGGLVFDPFCGTGTTAVAAARLGRQFIVTDVDANYVRIAREKLAALKEIAQSSGISEVPRVSIKRPRPSVSKKSIEVYLQQLAGKLNRVPTETDVRSDNPEMLKAIGEVYPYPGAAFKRAKVALQT